MAEEGFIALKPIQHKETSIEQEIIPQGNFPPWVRARDSRSKSSSQIVNLHNEILDFLDLVSLTEEEQNARASLVSELKDVIKSVWPTAKVELYGSSFTELLIPSSDIDLVVLDFEDNNPLRSLERALRKKCDLSSIERVESARVPIIKLVHANSGLSADISFHICSGLQTGQFVRDCMVKMPEIKPLVIVLKYFLMQRDLNETYHGGVGSFLLQLMVISFLQHRELTNRFLRRSPNNNLGSLLIEFFELYGVKFNYHSVGICVEDSGSYFRKEYSNFTDSHEYPCVINPIDPEHDVGKNSYYFYKVKKSFEFAYRTLIATIKKPIYETPTILGKIIAVDLIITHRSLPVSPVFKVDISVSEENTKRKRINEYINLVQSSSNGTNSRNKSTRGKNKKRTNEESGNSNDNNNNKSKKRKRK